MAVGVRLSVLISTYLWSTAALSTTRASALPFRRSNCWGIVAFL